MAKAKYKRGVDGYFQAKVWDGTYVNGQKHRIPLRTKKSSKALEDMVIEHNRLLKDREYIRPSDLTFLEYAREWKKAYKSGVSKNTQAMYENIIEKHLYRVHGKINEINSMHYHMLINSIPGARTQQQASMTFKQIVKSAIRDRLLPAGAYDDLFDGYVKIKYKAPEKRPLTDSEKEAVFKANFQPSDKAFVFILYGCGLRRGEALALNRFDISLKRKELTVNKALAFEGNIPYIKSPKSEHGARTVPIPDKIFPALEEYISSLHGTKLFPFQGDHYITKSSYRKKWERIVREMNLVSSEPTEGLTAHIFRHNYCSSLCYMIPEISIRKIAELMGDTDKMVIDVYNHIISRKEKPHEVVGKALNF